MIISVIGGFMGFLIFSRLYWLYLVLNVSCSPLTDPSSGQPFTRLPFRRTDEPPAAATATTAATTAATVAR